VFRAVHGWILVALGLPRGSDSVKGGDRITRYTGPPMDLTNMRSLGVTRVDVYCSCGHQASVNVSNLPGDLAVPEIKHRLRFEVRQAAERDAAGLGSVRAPSSGWS
jgi:hypothetical protein